MYPKTQRAFTHLELLIDSLPFYSPVYRDTGRVYSHPFIWNSNVQGEFNTFKLFQANEYIKSTDVSLVIRQWQDLKYAEALNRHSFDDKQIKEWQSNIGQLLQIFGLLKNIQAYIFNFEFYSNKQILPNGIIVGQIDENCWVGITSTVYISDKILKPELDITPIVISPSNIEQYGLEQLYIIHRTIATLKSIDMCGDFGWGNSSCYYSHEYFYTHKIVCGVGKTKELAWESTLLASEMLEIGVLNKIYPDFDKYIYGYYPYTDEEVDDILDRYQKIDKLIKQEFENPTVYQIGAWTTRNIYIVGECEKFDRVGIYINSKFAYTV